MTPRKFTGIPITGLKGAENTFAQGGGLILDLSSNSHQSRTICTYQHFAFEHYHIAEGATELILKSTQLRLEFKLSVHKISNRPEKFCHHYVRIRDFQTGRSPFAYITSMPWLQLRAIHLNSKRYRCQMGLFSYCT